MVLFLMAGLMAQATPARTASAPRAAIVRALPPLQRAAAEFVAKRSCVSCHHNVLPVLAFHLARDRGFTIDPAVLDAVEDKTLHQLRNPTALDDAIQPGTINDPTPDDSLLLMAGHAAGLEKNLVAEVYARRLVHWQRDGHWVTSDFRPPHSSSLFTATATAVRAIRLYMPAELATEVDIAVGSARHWLSATRPVSTEDAAFRVMGLVWADASAGEIEAAARDLLALQGPSGGWPQLRGYRADAYSTGEALVALHDAGKPAADAAWRKGRDFLIATQAADGTWRVRTRMVSPAEVSPTYFPTTFPYGRDEYLSYAGSCWAVMALLDALPETTRRAAPPQAASSVPPESTPWVRTALFGTPAQLASLLDRGLDPNSTTSNGTTLLMMAVPDAEKTRLLLARGADARARASSGFDALAAAAAYRGTTSVLNQLLAAGADAQPPQDLHLRKTPLVLASMTGDLENVALLLARRVPISGAALSNAVTFGYADVARALMASGADAGGIESSGINLLHWAAITNRPQLIQPLAEAGVRVDLADRNGYTPLMYAATIDFGDTAVIEQLLKAGADRSLRDLDGRTALAQARRYSHRRAAAILR